MVYKFTLLKELPYRSIGSVLYAKGSKVSSDGESWVNSSSRDKELIGLSPEWIKREPCPEIIDDRPRLSEHPGIKEAGIELLSIKELLDKLDWKYVQNPDGSLSQITCCGKSVTMSGFFGVDHGACEECGKSFQDFSGVIISGSSAGFLDLENYNLDDGKVFAINKG